jgi:hypothetical protein
MSAANEHGIVTNLRSMETAPEWEHYETDSSAAYASRETIGSWPTEPIRPVTCGPKENGHVRSIDAADTAHPSRRSRRFSSSG